MGRIYLSAFGALFLVLPAFVYSATSLADNGNQIPIHLRHCYNTTTNYHRSFRSPMTFEALLSIIRKFESSPAGTNLGAKDVAAIIQHYVRFDGIEPAPVQSQLQQTSGIIPFAPSGNDFYSFNLVNTMFNSQPNQDVSILNNALTKQELCNLHFMVSHSIDANKRSDENCNVNVLAKVAKRRFRRAEREELDPKYQAEKVDFPKPSTGIAKASLRQAPSGRQLFVQRDRSACPVENGVIKTPTGVVAIGTVIAGIASGLLPQTVDLRQYLSTDELNQFPDSKLDNVWASTMGSTIGGMLINVGDLVSDYVKAIGLTGNFNESVNYQWYLLTADKPGYVTDAQLRGAMDGLWLGSKIKAFVDMNSNTKLSQILDMYYSDQGVGDVNVKSCNRKSSYADYSNDNDFYNEVGPFTVLLHKNSVNSATITDFTDFVTQTMGSVKSAINQVDGTQCANNNGQAATPDYALNLVVVIDNTWPGTAIKDIITVLAENQVACEPFLSNTTIICGRDGKILFQGRDYSNFTSNFTVDVLRQCAPGIDLSSSLYSSEVIFRNLFANEESSGQVTRGSSAILFLPYSQDSLVNSSAATDFRNNFVRYLPDVKFLVATNGPNSGYDGLVTESSTDVFTIRPPNSDPAAIADIGRIANALQTVPQRLAYPQCGTYYTPSSWGSGTLKDNVAINSIKYYKLPANYFYSISNQPRVSIQSTRGNQLTVCFSRTNPQPSGDATVSNSGTNTGTNPNSRYNPNYPSNYNPSYGGNNPGYGSNNNPGYGGNSNPGYGSNNNPSYPDNSYYPNNNNPNNPNNNIYRNTYNNQPRRYNRQFSSLSTDDSTCISVNSAAQALALPENPCTGYYTISECPPFYISVSAPPTSSVPSGSCVSNCRYPSNAEYTITLENLSCDNGASSLLLNPIVLTIITFISVVRFLW